MRKDQEYSRFIAFPFAERLPGKSIHTEISPLRVASVEMIKEKALLPTTAVVRMEVIGWLAAPWQVFAPHHTTEAGKADTRFVSVS